MIQKIALIRHSFFGALLILLLVGCHAADNEGDDRTSKQPKTSSTDSATKEFLFDLPQDFKECHASTLLKLPNGDYLAAWFGGTKEGNDDVGIWLTKGRSGDWKDPQLVAKIRDDAHWNPVLFRADNGKIYLFFKVGKKIPQWETWVKTSDDEGETWSNAYELVTGDHGGRGPVRSKMLVLENGDWLAGSSNEEGEWNAFFDLSSDEGKTWRRTPYLKLDRTGFKGKGIIQPTIWESAPGNVHALLRSSEGIIYRSDSHDGGKTWSEAKKTELPNPNSGIDVVRLSDGTLLLAYNPIGENWGLRADLALAVSHDNGATWPQQLMIEQHQKDSPDDEYSYPALISDGESVALTYTFNRKQIAFWSADREWIMAHLEDR